MNKIGTMHSKLPDLKNIHYTAVLSVPGSYYFKPGSSDIRPEILEKERQIRQGHY